jgi:hypothetical protein
MSSADRQGIIDPAVGLMVFDSTNKAFYYFTGTGWLELLAGNVDRIVDTDGDTKILVEDNPDEDIIRFTTGGTEHFRMQEGRLGVHHTGESVFIGNNAGTFDNLSSNENVAIGEYSSNLNVTGKNNVAIGHGSLANNTANKNTAIGHSAMRYALTGIQNTALGYEAGSYNEGGSNNVFLGNRAGRGPGTHSKSNNVMIGHVAGYNNIGDANVFLGFQAGRDEQGSNKLIIANNAESALIYGEFDNELLQINGTLNINNTFSFPTQDGLAGQVLSTNGTGVVSWSEVSLRDADNDTKVQVEENPDEDFILIDLAGTEHFRMYPGRIEVLESGMNTYFGESSGLNDDLSVHRNSAFGWQSMKTNSTGGDNSAFGSTALQYNTTGNSNSAFGSESLLSNITGNQNTGLGLAALYANSEGDANTAVGGSALGGNTTGSNNTAVGALSLLANVTGINNTAIGYNASVSIEDLNNVTLIGANTIGIESNSVILGNDANVGIGTSAPQAKLHIAGNTFVEDGELAIQGALLVRDDDWALAIDSSAALEIQGTTRGFLLPRLTSSEMYAIESPADGLQIYNTDNGCTHVYSNNEWKSLCALSSVDSVFSMQEGGVGAWLPILPFPGGVRESASGFAIGDKGYMGLGEAQQGDQNDLFEYDPATGTWTQMPDFPGNARCMSVAVTVGDVAYIGLGEGGGSHYKDFYKFDPDGNSWSQIADYPGIGVHQAVGFAIDGKMYVGLGNSGTIVYKTFYVYDPDTNIWTQLPDFPGVERYAAIAVSLDGKGYIGTGSGPGAFGGTGAYRKDWWCFNPADTTWTRRADFPTLVRHAVAVAMNGKAYVVTGWLNYEGTRNFWEYDPISNSWILKASYGGTGRFLGAGFAVGGRIYMGTGESVTDYPDTELVDDMWGYHPEAGVFTSSIQTDGSTNWVQETWRKEGENIFAANCGNIGIGPADPSEKLHVQNGNVFIEKGDLLLYGNQNEGSGEIARIEFGNIDGESPTSYAGPKILARRVDDPIYGGVQDLEIYPGFDDSLAIKITSGFPDGSMIGFFTSVPTVKFDVDNNFKLGDNGTEMEYFIKETVTHNVGAVPAGSPLTEELEVTGVAVGSSVIVSPANDLPAGILIAYAKVSAADTVAVTFYNVTGGALNPASMDFFVTVGK